MKELQNFERLTEKQSSELSVKKQQKKEYKFDSSLKPHSGHTVWEIDTFDLSIKPASFIEYKVVTIEDALKSNKEIVKNKGCVYISALNPTNAMKRYKQNKGSSFIPTGHFNL